MNYAEFCQTGIDLENLGVDMKAPAEPYSCTPAGAEIFGRAGVDGIHYCLIRGFGETVFAVSPMNVAPNYVHPLARTFSDFLRLLLACGSCDAPEQAWQWDESQFQAFLAKNPPTQEQTEVLEQLEPNNRKVTAYYLPDEEGKPTDVFLYQNDRYLDKVRPVVTYNRVMAEQTEEDRVAYTEQAKIVSHFGKYLNDHAIGKVGTGTPDQPTDDQEEELELPPVELSDDLPADLSADPESDYEWHSGISEAMRAISDM